MDSLMMVVIITFFIFCLSFSVKKLQTENKKLTRRIIWLTEKTANSIDRIVSIEEEKNDPVNQENLSFLRREKESLLRVRDQNRYDDFLEKMKKEIR